MIPFKIIQDAAKNGFEVAYSSDGKTLALAHNRGVSLFDGLTGDFVRCCRKREFVVSLTCSANRNLMATVTRAGIIRIWNTNDAQHDVCKSLKRLGWFFKLSLSRDGTRLSGACAAAGKIVVVSLENDPLPSATGQVTWSGHNGSHINGVAFSPDDAYLATAADDCNVCIWQLSNVDNVKTLKGHETHCTSVAYSHNGEQLASGSFDQTVRIWNAQSGVCTHVLRGHTEVVLRVAFSQWNVFSASGDGTICVWHTTADDGICVRTLNSNSTNLDSLAIAPDGLVVAANSSDTVFMWRLLDTKWLTNVANMLLSNDDIRAPLAPYVALDIIDFLLADGKTSFEHECAFMHYKKIMVIERVMQMMRNSSVLPNRRKK